MSSDLKSTATAIPEPRPSWFSRHKSKFYPLIGAVVLIGAWELIVRILDIKPYVLPSPSLIFGSFLGGHLTVLGRHAFVTAVEAVVGYLIGSAGGFLFGIVFARIRAARLTILPYVVASTTVPIIAFAPIVIIWFGPGMASKIVIVAFLTFFPVCLGTLKGLMSTDNTLKDLFHSYAATDFQTFTKLEVVFALPYMFTALRVATPAAIIGAIVAEFVAANAGLGYLTVRYSYVLDTPKLWATILVACLLGIAAYTIMSAIERLGTPWHESIRAESE